MQTSHGLPTEAADPRYQDVDTLSVAEIARLMNQADQEVPLAVGEALGQIIPAIEAVSRRMAQGGRLIYVGAGTPGRIGVLDASEIPPTFSAQGRVLGVIAGGPEAIVNATEGAEDDEAAGAAAMDEAEVGRYDSVLGIAASGRTPFVIGGVRRARERGALSIGLSCNPRTPLSSIAEHGIEVIVGPEIVRGSTRLKAGTAQKLVLNMFSTISMIRLGKTYGNFMVDVQASNEKLRRRAQSIVLEITGSPAEEAQKALEAADFSVPAAVVMLKTGLDAEQAGEALASAGGRLRDTLNTLETAG